MAIGKFCPPAVCRNGVGLAAEISGLRSLRIGIQAGMGKNLVRTFPNKGGELDLVGAGSIERH